MLEGRSQTEKNTYQRSHHVPVQALLSCGDRNQKVFGWGWVLAEKGPRRTFGGYENVLSGVSAGSYKVYIYIYVKIHHTVHLKSMHFIVCKLHLARSTLRSFLELLKATEGVQSSGGTGTLAV